MMQITQGDTSQPVPFFIAQNAGDFPGASGLMPTVALVKNGSAASVPAFGTVQPGPGGVYWFLPAPQDVDTPGPVVMLITAPSGDIAPPQSYFVVPPSWLSLLLAIPKNIAAGTANSRLLAKALIPPNQQGLIQ